MRQSLKFFLEQICLLAVLPAYLCFRISGAILGTAKAFPGWSHIFSLFPGLIGAYLRRAFYRLIFNRCGRDSFISFGTVFSHSTVEIGDNAYIGIYCIVGDVTIEEDVLIASRVSIANGGQQHGIERLDIPVREQPGKWPRITIGRDTWIGEGSIILADVGRHCVIGAGSVVTKCIPDFAIARGVPAHVVGSRKELATGG